MEAIVSWTNKDLQIKTKHSQPTNGGLKEWSETKKASPWETLNSEPYNSLAVHVLNSSTCITKSIKQPDSWTSSYRGKQLKCQSRMICIITHFKFLIQIILKKFFTICMSCVTLFWSKVCIKFVVLLADRSQRALCIAAIKCTQPLV